MKNRNINHSEELLERTRIGFLSELSALMAKYDSCIWAGINEQDCIPMCAKIRIGDTFLCVPLGDEINNATANDY